ncbi:omptin family outer membrane protease [Pararhizobium qamdonense]|uniref:omptin family outer membrane protease n=1 Tax=Pararhizobium qamdonense TaxID=3031126 RepID=UPI0023E2767C|nr:omptin family outer membrane protease [Pararhizobium qamdonense]
MNVFWTPLAGIAILCATTAHANDLYGQATEGPVSMTFDAGLANIYAEESVFSGGRKISRLDWESKGVTVLRGALSIEVLPDWAIRAEGKTGMNGDGHMTDYDWLAPNAANSSDNGWSHRSIHDDTRLDHYYSGSIELNRTFVNDNGRFLSAGIGGRYTDVQWTAYGGSFIYSVFNPRDFSGNFQDGERGITYRQQMPSLYGNLRGSQNYGDWTLSGGVEAGALIKAKAPDDHWMRNLRFTDTFDLGFTYGATTAVAYNLTQNISFYASGAVEVTNFGTGDTNLRDTVTGASANMSKSAGANFVAASVSLGIKGKF